MFKVSQKLIAQVQKDFGNQIQTKRIKKQLDLFNQFPQIQPSTIISSIILTPTGLSIRFTHTSSRPYKLQLRIDKDYPFTPPQLHSLDNISYYGEGRDLLVDYFQEIQQLWSPSKMLRELIGMAGSVVKMVERGKGKELGKYHNGEMYFIDEMKEKGMEVFQVQQIKGKLIGEKKQKKIHFKVRDFTNIKADINSSRFKLITLLPDSTSRTLTFQSSKPQFSKILTIISPSSMLEKEIQEMERGKYEVQKLLGMYTGLLEHYTRGGNKEGEQHCMNRMRELMSKHYGGGEVGKGKGREKQEEKKVEQK